MSPFQGLGGSPVRGLTPWLLHTSCWEGNERNVTAVGVRRSPPLPPLVQGGEQEGRRCTNESRNIPP